MTVTLSQSFHLPGLVSPLVQGVAGVNDNTALWRKPPLTAIFGSQLEENN